MTMEIWKMLNEALDEHVSDDSAFSVTLRFDLNAAAEAFLAKVRLAESEECFSRHPRGSVTIAPERGGRSWTVNGVGSYPSPEEAFRDWMLATPPKSE